MIRALLLVLLFHSVQGLAQQRIVSAGGSVTEIIYALGHGDDVVATDSTSLFPPEARSTVKLGYFRQLSVEGVLAQQPSLLIGAEATGPDTMLAQVKQAGVKVLIVGEDRSLQGLNEMISTVASTLDAKEKGNQLINRIQNDVDIASERGKNQHIAGKRALYIVASNDRGITVAGNDTVPQSLFDTLQLNNIASDLSLYKVMDNEAIVIGDPEIIFVAGHTIHNENSLTALCSHPAIAQTTAGKSCNIFAADSSTTLGLSPRIGEALNFVIDSVSSASIAVTK